jgi:hypothetical protein
MAIAATFSASMPQPLASLCAFARTRTLPPLRTREMVGLCGRVQIVFIVYLCSGE